MSGGANDQTIRSVPRHTHTHSHIHCTTYEHNMQRKVVNALMLGRGQEVAIPTQYFGVVYFEEMSKTRLLLGECGISGCPIYSASPRSIAHNTKIWYLADICTHTFICVYIPNTSQNAQRTHTHVHFLLPLEHLHREVEWGLPASLQWRFSGAHKKSLAMF